MGKLQESIECLLPMINYTVRMEVASIFTT